MKLLYEPHGWSHYLNVDNWWLSVYFNPKHWAIDCHWNTSCCKFWFVIGPFKLNWLWSDDDDRPFAA